jgi:hypothetical protein
MEQNFLTCVFVGAGLGVMEKFRGLCSPDITPRDFFIRGYVEDVVYKALVTSLDELKPRIVAAIETVIPQILKNTSREIEYRLDMLRVMKDVRVVV